MKKKLSILILIISACQNQTIDNFKNHSDIKSENYFSLYKNLEDSIDYWIRHKLPNVEAESLYPFSIDSLLCFNLENNKFITCRHIYLNEKNVSSDDLQFIYGEKIDNKWYFFKGASIVIPRVIVKSQPLNKPLSYNQLHQIALSEVYSGYLDDKGQINESWFINHFENNGWGNIKNQTYLDWCFNGKRYTNKKDFYVACHLCKVKANWAKINKDSIKPLPQKLP